MAERTVRDVTLWASKSAENEYGIILGSAYCARAREWMFYILFGAGTSAGAITIESAHDETFSGTWAAQGSVVSWAAASRVHTVGLTGAFKCLRARISTAIVGGTASAFVVGN